MADAVMTNMDYPVVEPVCPQCASPKLTFLEHGPGGAVFRCEECGRATIQRWMVFPKTEARVPIRPRALMALTLFNPAAGFWDSPQRKRQLHEDADSHGLSFERAGTELPSSDRENGLLVEPR